MDFSNCLRTWTRHPVAAPRADPSGAGAPADGLRHPFRLPPGAVLAALQAADEGGEGAEVVRRHHLAPRRHALRRVAVGDALAQRAHIGALQPVVVPQVRAGDALALGAVAERAVAREE